MASKGVGKLVQESTAFFLCDIQEKFRTSIKYFSEIVVVAQRLLAAAKILDVPVVATEQYPKGLGKTVQELAEILKENKNAQIYEKTCFSMSSDGILSDLKAKNPSIKSVVLFGLEAHVCVQQTALDLLEKGFDVHLIADSSSSRSMTDRMLAFDRIRQAGGFITTSESVLFMLMKDAKHPNFKEIQKLIMESAPYQGLVPKL